MRRELTKAERRTLRELNTVAWERDLGTELALLAEEFSRWRKGEIDAFALSDRIHHFHDGRQKELWGYYQASHLEAMRVSDAIARGLLSEAEIDPALLEYLQPIIRSLHENQ